MSLAMELPRAPAPEKPPASHNEFLATLAHELRNPLVPMRMALHLMEQAGTNVVMQEQAREIMQRQVEHLTRLVEDLLDVARSAHGKLSLDFQQVDLEDIVWQAIEASGANIAQAGHELTVTLPVEDVWVRADPVRLVQVFTNLLNNAAKFTEPGGSIRVAVTRCNQSVLVRVCDTGCGIAEEMQPTIFEMYQQGRTHLGQAGSGLGIGLALVKRLVKMHGGAVTVHSGGPGQGSEFTVELPVIHAGRDQERMLAAAAGQKTLTDGGNPLTANPPGPNRPRGQKGARLLIVDDYFDSADSLAMLMNMEGHQARVAYDGATALELAQSFQPDAVLLDLGLPGLNGYEVARQLREIPGLHNVLLIAMTGLGNPEVKRLSQEAGFNHHILKPVDPEKLDQLLLNLVP